MISVDTKKKELVGNFKNGGREWQPKGTPPAVLVHDFPTDAEGKAIPYSVYDMARNEAWVSVGWDDHAPYLALHHRVDGHHRPAALRGMRFAPDRHHR